MTTPPYHLPESTLAFIMLRLICAAGGCLFCESRRPFAFTRDRTSAKCTGCGTIMPGEWAQ